MRMLTSHKVAGLNEAISIAVLDQPSHGGACHHYAIDLPTPENTAPGKTGLRTLLNFQEGPIQEVGLNGNVSHEALLAIVEDRLVCFQAGNYACEDNAAALQHVQEAMFWLQKRTRDRMARGVEGTSVK